MRPLQKILCPVDTSVFSARALSYAKALAGWYGASIAVLYVRPVIVPPALWFGAPAVLPPEPEDGLTERHLESFVRDAIGAAPVTLAIRDGAVVHEILQTAAELPADLIVMGTHGHSGFERLLLGSVTEKTLRKAQVPVLTVPERGAERRPDPPGFETILCGMDRSATARRALDAALSLADASGARVVILHAVEGWSDEDPRFPRGATDPAALRHMVPAVRAEYEALVPEERRRRARLDVRVPQGRAYRELLSAAAELRADLIVLGAGGSAMPFGTTTQHVLRQADCPVLIVPAAPAAARDAR